MPTPSIQTLRTDAQQVLNLDSISAVRSVVAATLANANAGTPLNPNLTTQQLWNEFYQIVTQPKSDIESIIANQLMKFMYAPPAPGGVGADGQVIFNDGGVLAGDPQFLWNKTTNLLTVTGSATITGDLTVDTSTLKVDSTNNRVGVGTASPAAGAKLGVFGATSVSTSDYIASSTWAARFIGSSNGASSGISFLTNSASGFPTPASIHATPIADYRSALVATYSADSSGAGYFAVNRSSPIGGNTLEHYKIDNAGVATWSNVGGVAGTAMTLNSTGLGVGVSPAATIHGYSASGSAQLRMQNGTAVTGRTWYFNSFSDGNLYIGIPTVIDALTVTPSGNVGIGVTPGAGTKLDVNGNIAIRDTFNLTMGFGNQQRILAGGGSDNTFLTFSQWTGAAYTERMRIDQSGNVGIGVTPSAWAATFKPVQIGSGTVSSAFVGQTNSPVARIITNAYFDGTNFVKVQNNTAGMYVLSNNQHEWHNAVTGTGTAAFVQAMTLDASGNLLVGVASNPNTARAYFRYDTLTIQPVINSASIVAASTSWNHFVGQSGNGSTVTTNNVFIRGNGDIVNANGVYGTISDLRLKENISDARNYLSDLLKLRVVNYSLKEEASAVANKLGFIAQEVEQVFPKMVDTDKEDTKSIKISVLIPMLVKAIQELTARVQTLEAK
jgi:hypothetical protein